MSPDVTTAMTRDLDEGEYMFLCFLPTPKGQPHVAEESGRTYTLEDFENRLSAEIIVE